MVMEIIVIRSGLIIKSFLFIILQVSIICFHLIGSEQVEQITYHSDYNVSHPNYDNNQIVYENGGTIWVMNITSRQTQKIPITIKTREIEDNIKVEEFVRNINSYEAMSQGKACIVLCKKR